MTIIQGGATANRSGGMLEKQIGQTILAAHYVEVPTADALIAHKRGDMLAIPHEKWFTRQIALERNLYGAKYRLDFFVCNQNKFPGGLHIECKWQAAGGSVDEKYVFTVLSLKAMDANTVLILDGDGARKGAVEWIRKQQGKRFMFFPSIGQFNIWAMKNL